MGDACVLLYRLPPCLNHGEFGFLALPLPTSTALQIHHGVLRETQSGLRELQVIFPLMTLFYLSVCLYSGLSRKVHKKVPTCARNPSISSGLLTNEKCDEKRPECSRCLKMQRTCPGYRDQSDLMFRDETFKTQQRVRQRRAPPHGSYPGSKISVYSMYPSMQDFAVCHFYHTTMENLSDEDPVRSLHTLLPSLFADSQPGSPLCLATEAISYAASSRLVQEAMQLSRKRYVQAIKAIGKAIQDPTEVSNDQTLYAILLLCGYEVSLPISYPSLRALSL
jgi:hypothetical protein